VPKTIKDRKSVTDHVADVMHARWKAWSIDTLLCHPIEAIEMALDVAVRAGRISDRQARSIFKTIAALNEHGDAVDTINEICRTALSSRKRGDLKRDRH
jgi:hypothetical protein